MYTILDLYMINFIFNSKIYVMRFAPQKSKSHLIINYILILTIDAMSLIKLMGWFYYFMLLILFDK